MDTTKAIDQWSSRYPRLAVVGGYWGDEGKAKIIDYLAREADYVVRYSGGNNAGHTVVINGVKYVFHQLPSGFARSKACLLGPGVLFNLEAAVTEIKENSPRLSGPIPPVFVDERCPLWTPYHSLLEEYIEQSRGSDPIGTTRKAQGPLRAVYDLREGPIALHLLDQEQLLVSLRRMLDIFMPCFEKMKNIQILNPVAVSSQLCKLYAEFAMWGTITDTRTHLFEAITGHNKRVLFEGSQATGLSVDAGTWPFVTSSSVIAGGIASGTLLPPRALSGTLVVFKLFPTRVGGGAMPSELSTRREIQVFADAHPELFKHTQQWDERRQQEFLDERLRQRNLNQLDLAGLGEYVLVRQQELGATTGRARSPGMPDLVWARYAVEVNDPVACVMNCLDAASGMECIPVVTGYRYRGELLPKGRVPVPDLNRVKPVIEYWPGWREDIRGMTDEVRLPVAVHDFIRRFEDAIKCPVALIGTGPDRSDLIFRPPSDQWRTIFD